MCLSNERNGAYMKKGLTELVFILDRSGSMQGMERDTIGGFNGMIGKQQKEEGEAYVTTVMFDDQIEIIHDRFPIDIVRPLTEKDYYVRGCTALLDAVGSTIKKIENIQEHLPEERKAGKIVFVITTDGKENVSQEYTYHMVKHLIQKNQEKGWVFLFLGANIDTSREAENLGIKQSHAATYKNDQKGVRLNFEVTEKILSCVRSSPCDDQETEIKIPIFLKEIEKHQKEE